MKAKKIIAVYATAVIIVSCGRTSQNEKAMADMAPPAACEIKMCAPMSPPQSTEEYKHITENGFQAAKTSPLSTFAIDVDGASYSNTRRMLSEGILPPQDAVRI